MGKKDNGDLPPKLTRNSSRAEMWENIQVMYEEIDSQQREVLEWRGIAEKAKRERELAIGDAAVAQYQLGLIRAVLAQSFKAG